MDPYKVRGGKGPEHKIQDELIKKLKIEGWYVRVIIGVKEQSGLPDLFCTHPKYGHRWIDVKVASRYRITPAQREEWPKLVSHGSGVWIITGASQDDYEKLFKPCNFHQYF